MGVVKRTPYLFTAPITASGGLILGASTNTSLGSILSGSTSFTVASTTTGSTYVGTFTATGAPAGAKVWITPIGQSSCTVFTGACVSGANTITASFMTVASTSGSGVSAAKTVTMQWLVIA